MLVLVTGAEDLERVRALSRSARWQQERLWTLTDEVRKDIQAQQKPHLDTHEQEATR